MTGLTLHEDFVPRRGRQELGDTFALLEQLWGSPMDPRIADLKSITFSGCRRTRQQIADVQKTVALFSNHSRNELAKTICDSYSH